MTVVPPSPAGTEGQDAVLRRLLRRWIPFEVRLRIALFRRWLRDRRTGGAFASSCGTGSGFTNAIAVYERAIPIYPGQERFAVAKRTNQRLMAGAFDGAIIESGQLFSLWRYVGRPTVRRGYARAAALKNGRLTTDVGGATCLLATVVYNVALLGAMEIVERKCHSVDSYGSRRYFELGRDAAIEYGYTDLRFRNPHAYPVLLRLQVAEDRITAQMLATAPADFHAELLVSEPQYLFTGRSERWNGWRVPIRQVVAEGWLPGIRTHTRRIVRFADGRVQHDDLGESFHQPQPRLAAADVPLHRRQGSL